MAPALKLTAQLCFVIALAAFVCSCSDTDSTSTRSLLPSDIGNYWIYQWKTTYNGESHYADFMDSVVIVGDTVFHNRQWRVEKSWQYGTRWLRDSADCVVIYQQYGGEQIIYSTSRDTLVNNDNLYYRFNTDFDALQHVPAGTFRSVNLRDLTRRTESTQLLDGLYPDYAGKFYVVQEQVYAQHVGLIKKTLYNMYGATLEWELVRYKVN